VAWEDEFHEQETYPEMDAMWKNIVEAQGQPELNFDEEEEVWVTSFFLSFFFFLSGQLVIIFVFFVSEQNSGSMVNPFGTTTLEDRPYEFELDNPFMDHPSPFDEAMRLMEGGNLSDAALAFEAEVQLNASNAEAWFRLGTAQQENEKELPAISALRQAVALNPHNMDASLVILFVCLFSLIQFRND